MTSDVEIYRQMTDKEVEQLFLELKSLRTNNETMKKLLATIENINDLLNSRSIRCQCKQTTDTKFKTKLNVLNKKYQQLKNGLDLRPTLKTTTNLVSIKRQLTDCRIDESIAEDSNHFSDDCSLNEIKKQSNENNKKIDINFVQNVNLKDISDGSVNRFLDRSTPFDELEDQNCEFSCEFQDLKTGILCQKKFTNRETLLQHVVQHSGPKPWFCEFEECEYRSVLRSHLIGHIRKSHTARHQFHCDWPGCDFKGPSRYNIKRHKIIHTNEKPYRCDWPGCEFRSPNNKIAEHKRIHTGEKPFPCSWVGCDARFSRQFTLRNHLRTHTGEKPFKCDYPDCNYSSTQQTPLSTHKRKHHNSSKESSEEVIFSDNIVPTDE